MQKVAKQVNTQKSTNNPLSSFGLIEENKELSHIHLAVPFLIVKSNYLDEKFSFNMDSKLSYALYRGAFCQFPFRWIYYCHSS